MGPVVHAGVIRLVHSRGCEIRPIEHPDLESHPLTAGPDSQFKFEIARTAQSNVCSQLCQVNSVDPGPFWQTIDLLPDLGTERPVNLHVSDFLVGGIVDSPQS